MQFFALRANPANLWGILIILTSGVLCLDWVTLDGILWQHKALDFPTAWATVTRSEVVEHRGSKGSRSYTLEIVYTFDVEGRSHAGTRLRYYAGKSSRRQAVVDLRARYRVGDRVIAYYPPENPPDAILLPGVEGSDWLRLMPAVAASLVLAGAWGLLLTRRPPFDPANPAWLTETEAGWRVRLPAVSHRAVFIVAFGVASLVAWLGLNLREGDNPDPLVVGAVFAAVVAAAAVASVLFAHERFLEADLGAKELVLPAPWMGESVRVPFGGIASARVRREERSAGKNGTYEVFHCDVGWGSEGRIEITTLATFLEREQAERLALWVRLNCGLASPEGESPS